MPVARLVTALMLALALGACTASHRPGPRTASTRAPAAASRATGGILGTAYHKTLAGRSARVAISDRFTSASDSRTIVLTGGGAYDFAAQRGYLALTYPVRSGTETIQALYDGRAVYEKSSQTRPGSTPWVRFDSKVLGGIGSLQGANDPTSGLAFLQGAVGTPMKVGTEMVHGTATTRYAAVVDPVKAAAIVTPALRDNVARIYKAQGITTIPVGVWIDAAGMVRRVSYDLRGKQAHSVLSQEFYDFGVHVSVHLPPERKVTTAA